ncbi:hypothetical protein JVT61DRAFT_11793 [Boletus reticuloceps]|uniref:Uncharacterized protein n=1 Tax=Boletus reticuloceps TaxID=495285 RepID=A0A8I2YYI5_9AGAM|nr:hypothetical protein JVT61DRAFT_11793 [Boletus reticuloceps]
MEPPVLDNTYRPMKNLPSDSGHPSRTRFTLHRILSAVTAIAFAISKFIVSLHGATFTSGLFDVVLATLGTILFASCWYEPSPRLRWLFDTDWDYLLDATAWGRSSILRLTRALAEIAKNNY